MIATAEGLLHRWGKWSRDNPRLLLSSTSILGRVMEEGASGASQATGKPEISMADDIALIERAVLRLDDEFKLPIVLRYVQRMPAGQACKACHLHPREHTKILGYGIYFVAGFIAK